MSNTADNNSHAIKQVRIHSSKQAQDIIEDIQFRNGHINPRDEAELSKTSPEYQEKVRRRANNHRGTLARFTRTYVALKASDREDNIRQCFTTTLYHQIPIHL
jgi:hypothetical protein